MLSELAFPHIRCCLSAIPSDLMKSTAVDEILSSMNQQFCSRENQLLQNSLLYLRIMQDKYITLYRELITQLCTYASAIRILAKGYLPNTLLTPEKLQEILMEVRKALQATNPDYNLVID